MLWFLPNPLLRLLHISLKDTKDYLQFQTQILFLGCILTAFWKGCARISTNLYPFTFAVDFVCLLHSEAGKLILFPQAFGLTAWTCSSYLLKKNKCIESCAGNDGSLPMWGALSSVRSLPISPEALVPGQQGTLASAIHYSDSLPACPCLAALLRAFTFTQAWETCPFLPVRDCTPARGVRGPLHTQQRLRYSAETGTGSFF